MGLMKQPKGYTIHELMIVGAMILALLTAAGFYLANYVTKAKEDAQARQLVTLNRALEEYRMAGGISRAHSLRGVTTTAKIGAVVEALRTGFTADDGRKHNFLPNTGDLDISKISATHEGNRFHFTTVTDGMVESEEEASTWTVDGCAYTHRKKITIKGDYVDEDLTNFPLLVKISSDTDIGGDTNSDGYDIRFTSSDGSTALPYERCLHSVSGGALTAVYWVRIPTVLSDGTTYIYVYYRTEDTSDGSNTSGTWSGYEAVYHLDNGTTLSGADSSGNGRTLTAYNATAASGKVNGGSEHDGTDDYLYGGDVMDIGLNDLTLSIWVRWDSSTETYTGFMGKGYLHGSGRGYGMGGIGSSGKMEVQIRDKNTDNGVLSGAIKDGTWRYFSATFDRDGYLTLYINGAAQSSPVSISSLSATSLSDSFTFAVGSRSSGDGTYLFDLDGGLDEGRVIFTLRSAAFIKFEYYNMASSDNELTWGSQETCS